MILLSKGHSKNSLFAPICPSLIYIFYAYSWLYHFILISFQCNPRGNLICICVFIVILHLFNSCDYQSNGIGPLWSKTKNIYRRFTITRGGPLKLVGNNTIAYNNIVPCVWWEPYHLKNSFCFQVESRCETSNGSWCIGIKGEMSGTVCVTFTWDIYIYMSCL